MDEDFTDGLLPTGWTLHTYQGVSWMFHLNQPGGPYENTTGGIYYPGYPGWGWWYPPCFGCGGYWPPTFVSYSWNTGTVVMTLFDGETVGDGNEDVEAAWIGGLNGVLSSSANGASRITTGIDQAFTQSPYLSGSGS